MKHYSFNIAFKKQHCVHCGEELHKERTTRVVTKEDKDYYEYHRQNRFPRRPVEVNDQQYQCLKCGARYAVQEQKVLAMIQKQQGTQVLSGQEIREHYKQAYEKVKQRVNWTQVVNLCISFVIVVVVLFFSRKNGEVELDVTQRILQALGTAAIVFAIMLVSAFFARKKRYTYDEKYWLNTLYAHSKNNRVQVEESEDCYCFHCMQKFPAKEVVDYAEGDVTARCPYCKKETVLPENEFVTVGWDMVEKMNQYWF